ncbi:hypothetical protein ACOMHN_028220 [Nucella lapillus]
MLSWVTERMNYKTIKAERLTDLLLAAATRDQVLSTLTLVSGEELQELASCLLPSGHTLLHVLCRRQRLAALQLVLQRGVKPLALDEDGATPLHMALLHNCLQAAHVLIQHGAANVDEVSSPRGVISRRRGTTLLHQMVACDRPHTTPHHTTPHHPTPHHTTPHHTITVCDCR